MESKNEYAWCETVDVEFIGRTRTHFHGDSWLKLANVKFPDGSVREVHYDSQFSDGLLKPGTHFRATMTDCGTPDLKRSGCMHYLTDIRLISDPCPPVEPLSASGWVRQLWKENEIFSPGDRVLGRLQQYLSRWEFLDVVPGSTVALAAATFVRYAPFGRGLMYDVWVAFPRQDTDRMPREGMSFMARIGKSEFAGPPPYRAEGTIFTLDEVRLCPRDRFAPRRTGKNRWEQPAKALERK